MRRHEMPNLGLSIDLPETWRPVLELGAVELRDLSRADMGIGRELDRWIHTSSRFEPGGDMGLVAVDPETMAMLRIGIILPADDRLDAVTLGRALFGEEDGVVIKSAEPMRDRGRCGRAARGRPTRWRRHHPPPVVPVRGTVRGVAGAGLQRARITAG